MNVIVSPLSRLYLNAKVSNSSIGDYSIIGDFSRVVNSSIGIKCRIDRNNFITDTKIGDYTYTGPFDMIFKCEIGKFSSISYGVTIGPPEHNYKRITMHPFIHNSEYEIFDESGGKPLVPNDKLSMPISIGNDVWVGANVTILRGTHIGDGAVIGANSLVNKDVPPYAIVAGVPARIIKYRFSDPIISKLKSICWWDWSIERIRKHKNLFKSELTEELLSLYNI